MGQRASAETKASVNKIKAESEKILRENPQCKETAEKQVNLWVVETCELLTKQTKNDAWFTYTQLILNITLVIALAVFFEKMFSLSSTKTAKKCRNTELQDELSVILATFFIVNIVVQIINIIINAYTNIRFGALYKNCEKFAQVEKQISASVERKTTLTIINVVRVLLILLVVGLLIFGIVIWNKCKQSRAYEFGDIFYWYCYFNTPREFTVVAPQSMSDSEHVTLSYEYTDDYYVLKDKYESMENASQSDKKRAKSDYRAEYIEGNWTVSGMRNGEPFSDVYRYDGENYVQDESILQLRNILTDEKINVILHYSDYNNVTPMFYLKGENGFEATHLSLFMPGDCADS